MNKILLIDKPVGWTSFDVVARIRGEIRKKLNEKSNSELANDKRQTTNDAPKRIRVGHAGTLDPFATGLLIVLVGDATKEQDRFMKLDKEYEATLKLGYVSTTGDPEGVINQTPITNYRLPNLEEIKKILKKFTGEIEQTPPIYSAIKIDGQRAYKLARRGQKVEMKPRKVTIYGLEIIKYDYPSLELRVGCSSGTYIRTLAEDIGKALDSGAYLTDLRRTKIGKYSIDNAISIGKLSSKLELKNYTCP